MPDNHRRRVPPRPPPPSPQTPTPPPLLLFPCVIQPRDFQCGFLEKRSLRPSVAESSTFVKEISLWPSGPETIGGGGSFRDPLPVPHQNPSPPPPPPSSPAVHPWVAVWQSTDSGLCPADGGWRPVNRRLLAGPRQWVLVGQCSVEGWA